jgi:DeoR/GlpR family transcriptional regulator of sugar metabolism
VTDHSKIGVQSRWMLCPTKEVDSLITDADATDAAIAPFESLDIEVVRV